MTNTALEATAASSSTNNYKVIAQMVTLPAFRSPICIVMAAGISTLDLTVVGSVKPSGDPLWAQSKSKMAENITLKLANPGKRGFNFTN